MTPPPAAQILDTIYRHLARVRHTTIDDARQRFPDLASIHTAYGRVLPAIWAVEQAPPEESSP